MRAARPRTVRAGFVVRFRGLGRGRVAAVAAGWREHRLPRSATCLDGALARLRADAGIRLAVPPRGEAWLAPVFVSILSAGFVDSDGAPLAIDLYGTLGLGEGALARAMASSDAAFRKRARLSRAIARMFGGKSPADGCGSAFPAFDLSGGAD